MKGYDGHSLRAWYYNKSFLPKHLQEFADKNQECYTAKVGSKNIVFKDTDIISYKGQILTGKQLYEQIKIK